MLNILHLYNNWWVGSTTSSASD